MADRYSFITGKGRALRGMQNQPTFTDGGRMVRPPAARPAPRIPPKIMVVPPRGSPAERMLNQRLRTQPKVV